MHKGAVMENRTNTSLSLSQVDIGLICKALKLYDMHVSILNSDIFPVPEDELSDMNNDAQYIKGLISHLQQYMP